MGSRKTNAWSGSCSFETEARSGTAVVGMVFRGRFRGCSSMLVSGGDESPWDDDGTELSLVFRG